MTDVLELSPVDLEILRVLQNDARTSNKDLAATVGLAPSTCLDRVNRLREAGVITGQRAQVDAALLGRPLEAFLFVQVRPHRRPLVERFVAHLLGLPEVRAVYHLTGPDDFLAHVATTSAADLQRLVMDELTSRDEIARVHTNLVFQQWQGGPLLPPEDRRRTAQ
ncbi:Lrp/AsnC family transcriptional regulator [Amycolatopsis jiangsuensis]|uniref:DNA-binding Lrp family transcriptional regulator n=1 Tax=Amycolatopsis jiangsuensis TaxID=1181879 RepID=A0A840J5Y2_9PSEU|nr:Lrp/AsnC family transcriptional regulator [Amycolatopsis jiangsuensis]MBB4688842.1 DNA-binding Lrp family transcriptional regulator [Amycolatopsis jiangsuensis]